MEHGFYKVLTGKSCPFDLVSTFDPLELMYPTERQKELKELRKSQWQDEHNPLCSIKSNQTVIDI